MASVRAFNLTSCYNCFTQPLAPGRPRRGLLRLIVAGLTHSALAHGLLAYLDQEQPDSPCDWEDWAIRPISGGANNRLYRATNADADLVVKWTLRDERDRAGREYAALALLERTGRPSRRGRCCSIASAIGSRWSCRPGSPARC